MTRKGYKHTELGEIPEDWEVKDISEVGTVITGSTPSRQISEYWNGTINWVTAQDFKTKYIKSTREKITNMASKITRIVPEKSVLVTCIASIGLNAITTNNCATNQQINSVTCNNRINNEYLYYIISHYKSMMQSIAAQTAVPIISKSEFEKLQIPLPPLPEQRAIASALSDVDALIEALDRLIDKKRKIKQGTMQQLLSGKKRLKGFGKGKGYKHTELGEIPEDWEVKTLGEIGYFKSGNGFPIIYQGNDNGIYPFYKVSDLNTSQNDCMNISKNYISDEVAEILKVNLIQKGSIVFAKIGAAVYLERKKILTKTSCIDNNMMAFTLYNTCYNKYIYHWMLSFRISTLSNTSALPSISASDLQGVKLPLPPLPEQRAIASVLSDMDAEIEALDAKRNKYAKIKQGMMQNLLTGRVRLPVKEV